MKKLLLLAFALAGASFGQTFTGTWQGVLKVPQAPKGELRIVVKISTTSADKLAAQFYSIDQGAQPIAASEVAVTGSTLKMSVAQINGTYEGKLSADGKTITGTWSQGAPNPLILTRATPETEWTIPKPPPPMKMMPANAKPEFEVATIKPSDPNRRGFGIGLNRSGMLNTLNTTLSDLVKFAYGVHPKQVIGAPGWFDTDKFDISAKPDTPGMPSVPQMQMMLQKLIADRFSLAFHKDKKELSAYAITVARGGERIKKEENAGVPLPGFGGPPQRGFLVRNATMAEFAMVLQAQFMDEPVVDQTGLGDVRYSFTLKFTPDPSMQPFGSAPAAPAAQPGASDPDAPPDLFSAMDQQLGLRMRKTKTQVDVMIIDKVQKPSPN